MLCKKLKKKIEAFGVNRVEINKDFVKNLFQQKEKALKTIQLKITQGSVTIKQNGGVSLALNTTLLMLTLSLNFLLLNSFLSYLDQDPQVVVWIASTLWAIMSLEMLGGRQLLNRPLTVCREGIG